MDHRDHVGHVSSISVLSLCNFFHWFFFTGEQRFHYQQVVDLTQTYISRNLVTLTNQNNISWYQFGRWNDLSCSVTNHACFRCQNLSTWGGSVPMGTSKFIKALSMCSFLYSCTNPTITLTNATLSIIAPAFQCESSGVQQESAYVNIQQLQKMQMRLREG